MRNAMRLILAEMLCMMLAAQEPEKEEGEAILEQCDTNKNEVTPLLWTVYGFRIKPHLSASIHS